MQELESKSVVEDVKADQNPVITGSLDAQNSPSSTGEDTGAIADLKPSKFAVTEQEPESPNSKYSVTETAADLSPQKMVSMKGKLIFQSLFETKRSPPGSPGSATSSSTLINPQSRKVSPLSLKDSTEHNSDSKYELDPVAAIEAETKKQLLMHLRKKTVLEAKVVRKAENLIGQVKALSAELKAAKVQVQNTARSADRAKNEACALTLTNHVLRLVMKDLTRELSREKHGAQMGLTQLEGETIGCQEKEGSFQNHLESVGLDGLSALNTSPSNQQECPPQTGIQRPETVPEENDLSFNDKYGLDPASVWEILDPLPPTAHQNSVKEDTREVLDAPEAITKAKGHEAEFDADDSSQDTPQTTLQGDLEKKEEEHKEDWAQEDATIQEPAVDIMQTHEFAEGVDIDRQHNFISNFEFSDAGGPATLWGILEHNRDEAKEDDRIEPDAKGVDIDREHNVMSNFEFSDAAGPATLWGILNQGQQETKEDGKTDPDAANAEIMDIDRNHNVSSNFEFSEAAGPATLWGILEHDWKEIKEDDSTHPDAERMDIGHEHDVLYNFEFTDAAEPATLRGILEPNRNETREESDAEDVDVDREHNVFADFEFSDAAGPATLWGILEHNRNQTEEDGRTDQDEEAEADKATSVVKEADAGELKDAIVEADLGGVTEADETVGVSDIPDPATMVENLRSEQDQNEATDQAGASVEGAITAEAEVSGTSTLCSEFSKGTSTAVSLKISSDSSGKIGGSFDVSNDEEVIRCPPNTRDHSAIAEGSTSRVRDASPTGKIPNSQAMNKTQKRKLERKRAQEKKAEEAASRRQMEEAAAAAKEPESLGAKRLRLQLAREARDRQLVEEWSKITGQ